MTTLKAIILMADYGHDPTETAVPFTIFKAANFQVHFATESGSAPKCDDKMLYGVTQKLLGAKSKDVAQYEEMIKDTSLQNPLSWSDPSFSLDSYDLVFLPGGHEKGVRQIIDSSSLQQHLATYLPQTLKPSGKTLAAICHGVQVLATTKLPDGKSALHDVTTTALPGRMESFIFWGTRLWLGDYYKTYGAGTDNVETRIRACLDDPKKQYFNSLSFSPFIHEDSKYNYVSGRFPPDAELLAERTVELVKSVNPAHG